MKPIRPFIFMFTVSAPEGRHEGEGDGEEGIEDGTEANMDEDGIVEYEPTDPGDDDKAVDVVRVVEVESKTNNTYYAIHVETKDSPRSSRLP